MGGQNSPVNNVPLRSIVSNRGDFVVNNVPLSEKIGYIPARTIIISVIINKRCILDFRVLYLLGLSLW